jgi:hypothetical protein
MNFRDMREARKAADEAKKDAMKLFKAVLAGDAKAARGADRGRRRSQSGLARRAIGIG